jgi:hypothetical protein
VETALLIDDEGVELCANLDMRWTTSELVAYHPKQVDLEMSSMDMPEAAKPAASNNFSECSQSIT